VKASLWLALAALALSSLSLAAQSSSADTVGSRRITCGTLTSRRYECSAQGLVDSVRLVRRTAFARCTEGSNWGYGDTLIWAGRGCRAEFEVTYRRAAAPVTRTISCGRASGQLQTCGTEGYVDTVRIVRDLSGRTCRQRVNWDYTRRFIWTRDGCRGDFEVIYRDTSTAPAKPDVRRITCGSSSAVRMQCKVGNASDIRVVRNLGSGECRRGSNWQYPDRTITAGNGCRAEFEMTVRSGTDTTVGLKPVAPAPRPAPAPAPRVISCGNASGSAMACNAFGTVATVRVLRDRSAGRCGQPSSWGIRDQTIWVARGCYGDFELTYLSK
jgi:hypothetical protein